MARRASTFKSDFAGLLFAVIVDGPDTEYSPLDKGRVSSRSLLSWLRRNLEALLLPKSMNSFAIYLPPLATQMPGHGKIARPRLVIQIDSLRRDTQFRVRCKTKGRLRRILKNHTPFLVSIDPHAPFSPLQSPPAQSKFLAVLSNNKKTE